MDSKSVGLAFSVLFALVHISHGQVLLSGRCESKSTSAMANFDVTQVRNVFPRSSSIFWVISSLTFIVCFTSTKFWRAFAVCRKMVWAIPIFCRVRARTEMCDSWIHSTTWRYCPSQQQGYPEVWKMSINYFMLLDCNTERSNIITLVRLI